MLRHRHTIFTLGGVALLVGAMLLVLGLLGVLFAVETPYAWVFAGLCPAAFLLPGAGLLWLSRVLSRQHARLKTIGGIVLQGGEVPLGEVAGAISVPEPEAERLVLMAIGEGYANAEYDADARVLRRRG